jgi:5-formyltetrahydrofolate cyclo-ligase
MEASNKAALRQTIRATLAVIPPEKRRASSLNLCAILREQPVWLNASSVLCFAPMSDEPDVMPLLEDNWTMNRIAALPRFESGTGLYVACAVKERSDIRPGRFGVLEPAAGCPVVPLNQLDLILVPGVGFDLAGRRLGRGKGFYDRLLAEVRGHKCGVAFDAQIVAQLPEEPHDIRVDSILTPTRWHLCPRTA